MSALKLFRRGAPRPSLKERAAKLKATASRVIRRPEHVAPEPKTDWDNPPEGFMAYPAGEPSSFINIALGIRVEAERLHVIAVREVARRASAGDCPGYDRAGRLDQLRRKFRIAELDRVANPERAIPTETVASNGTVYYEDAAGKAHRTSVADWIAFMAQRMNSVARQEVARQLDLGSVQDQEANEALHDGLRRIHRLDALHDLVHRADGVFEAAKEWAVGRGPLPSRDIGIPAPDPVLALIERHRQAYAEWLPFMEVTTKLVDGTPEYARADADERGPADRERAAYTMVLTARPTTLTGLIAWASYLPQALASNSVDPDEDGSRALASLCDAVLSLVPVSAPQPAPASGEMAALAIAAPVSDIAAACIDQIGRLQLWDENPDAVSEKQGNEEMDRWGAVFRRAIDEPSISSRDLAGKAYLMLADLDRFKPEEDCGGDDYRLMRVILREAIVMGGLACPARVTSIKTEA